MGKQFIIITVKWSKPRVFQELFRTYLFIQKYKPDTKQLNQGGTHSLAKKNAQNACCQSLKKNQPQTFLSLPMDGDIACGDVISGNRHDQY